ncbi:YciI family protein [Reichenbachiella versicolor]|uniref:YciI family protein n=1 Tax=Reichenbachiella versicolor TaxID=1821036 RepID=UPI000D6E3BAC|nr:YciI family protein [Reichenbachiella versicolor]
MKDFMMLFYSEPNPNMEPTPEEIEAEIKLWMDWIGGIGAKGKLKHAGEALGFEGKTVHSDGSITDGPYTEAKEIVGGFIIVTADNLEEAVALTKGCPVLSIGGKAEVREIMPTGDIPND